MFSGYKKEEIKEEKYGYKIGELKENHEKYVYMSF